MKDKVFENVEAILAGKRMKFLDPNRKALLKLHPSALTVWMAYWMFENDAQEAYPTMATLMDVTDISENTIRDWRDYLVETGWMIKLTGSAALRYIKPTNGAWNISVYRVNDPTSKVDPSNSEVPQKMTPQHLMGQNMTLPKLAPNGASTGTSAFTGTVANARTISSPTPVAECGDERSLRELKPVPSEERPEKPTPHEKVLAAKGEKDSEPTNPKGYGPLSAPPPTKFHCPTCDYSTRREADLLDHHETDHNPDSPRYNPWEPCSKCGFNLPRSSMTGHLLKCKGATQ
jgi:hypothetical protein